MTETDMHQTTKPRSPLASRPGRRARWAILATIALLAGCATTAIDENFQSAERLSKESFGSDLKWLTTEDAMRQAQHDVDARLSKPLSRDDAVRIALAYSPSLQALLFESAAASADATQAARLPNPIFTFERLVRGEGDERDLDIGRMLSVPVLDLILLPAKLRVNQLQQQQTRLKLSGDVVQAAVDARQAWVQAVAAQQSLQYFVQVKAAADASSELARRMQSVGNFSKLQRAREQAFAAEAVTQLARAQQSAQSAREGLVRTLGLNESQAQALKLPDRLPDLPAAPSDERTVAQRAMDQRLDVQMAKANLAFAAREQGLTRVTSVVNAFHVAGVRNSETGAPPQKGYELELALPIFDFGDASRARSQATYMANLNRTAALAVEAASQVRESYAGYRTAYDIAKHYRDELVPLRKTIAEENLLRYNGMLIGVFELLADAREQITSVALAIDAQRDFWLADAALQAAIIGRPIAGVAMEARPSASGGSAGGH
jgi:outer membrane protein TolC